MRGLVAAIALAVISLPGDAQVTYAYDYDPLGRLIKVTPSSANPACYSYDPVDNRTRVVVASGCTGAGGGTGTSPPQAVNNTFIRTTQTSTWSGNLDVLSNDTDPDLPNDTFTVTNVTGSAYASVASGGGSVYFSGPDGDYVLNYTMKDQTNQSSSATIYLYVASLQ